MPSFRVFLFDAHNRISRATEGSCEDHEAPNLAFETLSRESHNVHAVEVWHGSRRVARVDRGET